MYKDLLVQCGLSAHEASSLSRSVKEELEEPHRTFTNPDEDFAETFRDAQFEAAYRSDVDYL